MLEELARMMAAETRIGLGIPKSAGSVGEEATPT